MKIIEKKIFINFDCLILPFIGRVCLERFKFSLLGIPSIVSDVPGCNAVIKNNYNGFLCKPFSTDDLVLKIEKFINLSLKERIKMSYNSYKYVINNYDEQIVIREYLKLLK